MAVARTPQQFHDAGLADWRVVAGVACAYFATGNFDAGVRFVVAIADLAREANHHPDIDLRYRAVTVRLVTHDVGGLSDLDIALADQISALAQQLGVPAHPELIPDAAGTPKP